MNRAEVSTVMGLYLLYVLFGTLCKVTKPMHIVNLNATQPNTKRLFCKGRYFIANIYLSPFPGLEQ